MLALPAPVVWTAAGVMVLAILSRAFKGVRFYVRVLNAYLLLLTAAAYGVVASITLRLLGKVSIAQWATARAFETLGCPGLGIRFQVENEQFLQTRPAVFISNHQSELDILFLGRVSSRS